MWGSQYWGKNYWASVDFQANPIPQPPFVIGGGRAGSPQGRARVKTLVEHTPRRPQTQYEAERAQERLSLAQEVMDEEELAIILSMWLNLK